MFFCQILLDDPFFKCLVFTEHPYVQCLNTYNGKDKLTNNVSSTIGLAGAAILKRIGIINYLSNINKLTVGLNQLLSQEDIKLVKNLI